MSEIVKVAAISIAGAVLAILLRKDNPTGSFLVTLGSLVVIIVFVSRVATPVVAFMSELTDASGISPALFAPLLKALGIAILTRIAAETCREAGQPAIASYTEIAGSFAALYATLPLMSAVLAMAKSLLA